MTTDDKNTSPTICLFFDELGNGPSESRPIAREVREVREGDKIAVPRAFGLCWTTPAPPYFVEDGGFMIDTETATWLRDKLTAWLDTPRLAEDRGAGGIERVEREDPRRSRDRDCRRQGWPSRRAGR